MGRYIDPTVIRSIDDLSAEQGEKIRRLYVDERMTIVQVTAKMAGVSYPIVGKYLRRKGLKRSRREIAQGGTWQREHAASFQEHKAAERASGKDDD